MSVRPVVRRAEAAILLAEGNLDAVIDTAREAIVLLHCSDPEIEILEREWLEANIAAARAGKGERAPDPFASD